MAGVRRVYPMLSQQFRHLEVSTKGRGFYEVRDALERQLSDSGLKAGLATLQIQHTSASLIVQENADPEVRRDLERFFSRLCPDGLDLFQHTDEGPDDMPAHVRSVLTAVTLGLPFQSGQLSLGTWQTIYLWEHRRAPHRRRILLHLVGE